MFKEYINYLKDNPEGYWFKARLYGWGWTPARWQGWVVLLVFIVMLVVNTFRLGSSLESNDGSPLEFTVETAVLVLLLMAVCYKTGEKPRWQWGIPKKK